MRFSVYLKEQPYLESPASHKCSRDLAVLIIGAFLARQIGQNAIQLTTDESWRAVKDRLRGRPAFREEQDGPTHWEGCDGGQLKPPRPPEGLLLTYPLPDQRTMRVSTFDHTL